jgi:hypothetical protein
MLRPVDCTLTANQINELRDRIMVGLHEGDPAPADAPVAADPASRR